ncbi:hypothetical protein BDR05DRAFT_959052 [Suillus weaverae]|nr:hypothetical protein BDR05DRAFT_959052 [Suillus weaverae]
MTLLLHRSVRLYRLSWEALRYPPKLSVPTNRTSRTPESRVTVQRPPSRSVLSNPHHRHVVRYS